MLSISSIFQKNSRGDCNGIKHCYAPPEGRKDSGPLSNPTGILDSIVTQSRTVSIAISMLTFNSLSYNTQKEREGIEQVAMVLESRSERDEIASARVGKTGMIATL
jgi:hypothetical protein